MWISRWRELGLARVLHCTALHCTARILFKASLENLGRREEQVSVIRNAEFARQETSNVGLAGKGNCIFGIGSR